MSFWNYVSRGKNNWERDELWENRWELLRGWWWESWCGERTQAAVVESLQRSSQTTVCSSCLLLDTGLVWTEVAMPSVRFSVSLEERRREWGDQVSCQLVFERNVRILSFFSCTSIFTHVHRVGDAIQPSHLLSSPSFPAPNPCQHQGLFQWGVDLDVYIP